MEATMTNPLKAATLALATLLLSTTTGLAQTAASSAARTDPVEQLLQPAASDRAAPVANDGEAYHRADDAEQDPAEVRTTQALNAEIAARNQLAENQERADQEAYELERARYQATVDQATRARLAYEEEVRQVEAARRQWEVDRDNAERARAQYAADVLACRAGDRSRCPR